MSNKVEERREKILCVLSRAGRQYTYARQLASRYRVHMNTILQDIKELRRAGIGIHTGPCGGYKLSKHSTQREDVVALKKEMGIRVGQDIRVTAMQGEMYKRFKNSPKRPQIEAAVKMLCPLGALKVQTQIANMARRMIRSR